MSEESAEIVRRMYDAFHAGDAEGALSYFAEGVLVDTGDARPDRSVGKGREYLSALVSSWTNTWEGWRDEIADLRDLGDQRVLVVSIQRGRAKQSGIEAELRYAILYDLANEMIVSVRMYGTVAEALEAAGLQE
jgi:ketosteroid isomerase-like protein